VLLDAWPSPDEDTRLVFIVRNVEKQAIASLLDALA
jgi:hypothetical protein